jgi:arylsulfatase A-like enzyme
MPQLSRREFAASAAMAPLAPRRPNILFVMVDEMRFDAMGCAGHPIVKTPALDRLAGQGVRFSSAYVASPVCSPSRACAFTGRYAHVHGVTANGIPAHNGEIFLPSLLRHHGYHTAIAGKLHYTPKRFDYGFDQFWSFSNEGPAPELGYNEYLRKKHGSPAKWPKKPGTSPWPDDPLGRDVGEFLYPEEDFETDWISARSIEYLRSRKDSAQPWFLFTSYLKPHSPSVEPNPWFSLYDPNKIPVPALPQNAKAIRAAQRERARRHYVDDPEMIRTMTAKYYGAISHVDRHVGEILRELDRLGMASSTIVLFTADHGNMLGEKGRWFKGIQYDGSARVPLIWRGLPESKENGGRVVKETVENTDLLPAILEAAGLPVPQGVQGRSFLKLCRSGDPAWKNHAFSELRAGSYLDGGWKLIDNSLDGSGPFELYDLAKDPKEDVNLAQEPAQKQRVESMRKRLMDWRADKPAPVRVPGLATPAYASITNAEREKAIAESPDVVEGTNPRRRK